MLVRMWSENTPPLLVGIQTCIATVEISVAVPQKDGNYLPQDPAKSFLGISQSMLHLSQRHLLTHVHC